MQTLPRFDDPRLIIGAEGFSDAAVYELSEELLIVQSLDFFPPLVDDPFLFGQIAAANSLSDNFAMGADPKTALNIVGFPDDQLELSVLSEILRGGADRTALSGAVIAGGHSVRDAEIKYGLSVTGVVSRQQLLTNRNAQPGDVLVLTKPLGTGFVTTAFKAGRCPEDTFEAACQSMVQLNQIGRDAARQSGAHAATDITGFGLAGHAGELAEASGVTVVLDVHRLPLLPGADELAASGYRTRASTSNRDFASSSMRVEGTPDRLRMEFLFDPQTSGGMLLSMPAENAEATVRQARDLGATATCIVGSVIAQESVRLIIHA